jgi:ADP-dependent NAD(P)H-hydrate dehydratase / NAD(P)H-hydrate epimerase
LDATAHVRGYHRTDARGAVSDFVYRTSLITFPSAIRPVYNGGMPSPVISVAQMREWEKSSWAAGCEQANVIARVGEIVARRAAQLIPTGSRTLVLAGHGHNGDDTRAAAGCLPKHLQVQVCNIASDGNNIPEALAALEQRPGLILDGLFGIGLNRPLDSSWANLIERVNELQTQVLSVDVPSGLNAETGQPEGAAIRATLTLTLGAPKRGMLLPSAWPFVGRLELAPDIGLAGCPRSSDLNWTLPDDFADYPPSRPAAAHKGNFGRLAIVAGSLGYHGAAVLSARGAQRAQPGLITLHTSESVYSSVASQLQAVMVAIWRPNQPWSSRYDAILAGPGLAAAGLPEEMRGLIRHLWQHAPGPMIVDASALDWVKGAKAAQHNFVRLITPHPGEAARLLSVSVEEVEANRPDALREISASLGDCLVVLKGHQTLVGRSKGVLLVNSSGNPQLAQGGSGDVLAGYLAGLLVQPVLQSDPLKAVAYGVWQHGATADRLSRMRRNWIIEDLASEIGNEVGE